MGIGAHVSASNSSGTSLPTGNITTTTGSTLIACIQNFGSAFTATPVTDSKGNTWTQIGSYNTGIGGYQFGVFQAVNITGGTGHNFASAITASGAQSMYVCEVTSAPASPTITQNSNNSATSPYASPSISPLTPSVIVGFFMSNAASGAGGTETDTWGGSFASTDKLEAITDSSNFVTGSMAAKVEASAGTFNTSVTVATVTVSNSVNWIVAVQQPAGATSTFPLPKQIYVMP